MKKRIIAAFAAVLCLSLCSCGENTAEITTTANNADVASVTVEYGPSEITAAVLAEIQINSAVEKGIDDLGYYFTELDTESLISASYYMCASGAYPDEIAVLKFDTPELAEQGKVAVEKRMQSQITTYESYSPDEMYKLDNAVIEVNGSYIYYLVTSDNVKAEELVSGFFA